MAEPARLPQNGSQRSIAKSPTLPVKISGEYLRRYLWASPENSCGIPAIKPKSISHPPEHTEATEHANDQRKHVNQAKATQDNASQDKANTSRCPST